jgi:hypothetical protein
MGRNYHEMADQTATRAEYAGVRGNSLSWYG